MNEEEKQLWKVKVFQECEDADEIIKRNLKIV
jgi:hypothetical protein